MPSLLSLSDSTLYRIAAFLHEDKDTLCSLCLVNKSINTIASGVLYSKISVSSRHDTDALRDLCSNEAGAGSQCALSSSCLPRNSSHVQELEVTALIFPGPNQGNILRSLEFLLSRYTNLLCFRWQPSFCETELTIGVAHLLPRLHALKSLSMRVPFSFPPVPKASAPAAPAKATQNLHVIAEEGDEEEAQEGDDETSATALPSEDGDESVPGSHDNEENPTSYEYKPLEDDPSDPSPTKSSPPYAIPPREMKHLQSLLLSSPTNDVLIALPEVLKALECPIRSLYFEGNCGPVTPGTLTSLLRFLREVEHFGLGLTYSVKYEELIPFLDGLPKLRGLELFHYHQLYARTSPFARLQSLKSLKVRHAHTNSRIQAAKMCVWIRRLISASRLEELEVVCENSDSQECTPRGPGHGMRHDGLIEHLLARLKTSLRVLKIPGAYLGMRSLKKVFGKDGKGFQALEELSISLRRQGFDSLGELILTTPRLRSILLNVVNIKRRVALPVEESVLRGGRTTLRSVIVNGRGYRGEWTVDLSHDHPSYSELPKLRPVFRISEIVEERRSQA